MKNSSRTDDKEREVLVSKTKILHSNKDVLINTSFGPLTSTLTYWYLESKVESEIDWKDNLKKLVTVRPKKDLWEMHNYLELCSNLEVGCAYFVFKQGVLPDWSTEENAHGGRWVSWESDRKKLNDKWHKLLAMFTTEPSRLINGIVVTKKKWKSTLAVWVKDADDIKELDKIKLEFEEIL